LRFSAPEWPEIEVPLTLLPDGTTMVLLLVRSAMPMPAVTLKLTEELKARISDLAAASGKSPHAFMVDALTAQTVREESRSAFVASALEARQEVAQYGEVMEAADVHQWLLARAEKGKAARPRARKLVK
jgi:predicted transcriptional regulator